MTGNKKIKSAYSLALFVLCVGLCGTTLAEQFTKEIQSERNGIEIWTYESNLNVNNVVKKESGINGDVILLQEFDDRNNLTSKTDETGLKTNFSYNTSNQRTSITEAADTADSRMTTYEYISPDIDKVTTITRPSIYLGLNKITTHIYDSNLNKTSTTISGYDFEGNIVNRSITYTYNHWGQVLTIDGSRVGVNDTTSFEYYDCQNGSECGQISSITNGMGHVTEITNYDQGGQILELKDANGTLFQFAYDLRHRLVYIDTIAVSGETRRVEYTYLPAGQMHKRIAPDGSFVEFTYDNNSNLIEIIDEAGNQVFNFYDSIGNIIRTEYRSSNYDLEFFERFEYAYREYLTASEYGYYDPSRQDFGRDKEGRLMSQSHPDASVDETYEYDDLFRISNIVNYLGGITSYGYDVMDNITHVVAPNGATTFYEFDDLGNTLKENSPDRGEITFTYDSTGNRVTQSDARGITTNYTYDARNRLLSVGFPDPIENINYTYDNCQNGVGRLCLVTDSQGATEFTYDEFGNVIVESRMENGAPFTTSYAYDEKNQIVFVGYPSGLNISYIRDNAGRVVSASGTYDNEIYEFVTQREYRHDGRIKSQTLGNGVREIRNYNDRGQLINQLVSSADGTTDDGITCFEIEFEFICFDENGNEVEPSGEECEEPECGPVSSILEDISYAYDYSGNLVSRDKEIEQTQYYYDWLDRLLADFGSMDGDFSYTYDENGNRYFKDKVTNIFIEGEPPIVDELGNGIEDVSVEEGAAVDGEDEAETAAGYYEEKYTETYYDIIPNSNALEYVNNKTVSLDPSGNTLSEKNGKRVYTYNQDGHLSSFTKNTTLKAEYFYNYRRLRTTKNRYTDAAVHTFNFHYDGNGLLLGSTKNGKNLRDYVWVDGVAVAQIRYKLGSQSIKAITYINSNDLNTPIIGTNETGAQVVWRWDGSAFGETKPDKDPDGDGNNRNIRLRFPGQYSDGESGLFYNWNRYFDPKTGRYITSDPIGLIGGPNTYIYVKANPNNLIDPKGLEVLNCNRPVDGFPFVGNHAYLYDDTSGKSCGMVGSFGIGSLGAGEAGPSQDSCAIVEGSGGLEDEIIEFCRENALNGLWVPGINDCHNAVKDAIESQGLTDPGSPGGRF